MSDGKSQDDRLADETPPQMGEMASGALALFLWISFFVVGYLIPTGTLRDSLLATTNSWGRDGPASSSFSSFADALQGIHAVNDHLDGAHYMYYLVLVGISYTVSNIWFLCLLSSFLGCMGRRWSTPFTPKAIPDVLGLREVRRAYTTAMLRGFLVYLVVIAGYLVVLPETSLVQMTPNQYARLAGAVSALAFVVGWEPESVAKLITTVFARTKRDDDTPATSDGASERHDEFRQKQKSILRHLVYHTLSTEEEKAGPVVETDFVKRLAESEAGITEDEVGTIVDQLAKTGKVVRTEDRKIICAIQLRDGSERSSEATASVSEKTR